MTTIFVLRKEFYQQFRTTILFKGFVLICFKFYGNEKYSSAFTSNFFFYGAIAAGGSGPLIFEAL
jgi:hypothetical protein